MGSNSNNAILKMTNNDQFTDDILVPTTIEEKMNTRTSGSKEDEEEKETHLIRGPTYMYNDVRSLGQP